jgi:beta-galactosidase
MKNETGYPTRRSLLGQAVGAAGIVSVLAQAQAPPAGRGGPRVRDSFDFGWKFFRGDAPGAQQPDFTDTSWKDVDLPHDFSIEGPFSENAPARGQGGYLPTGGATIGGLISSSYGSSGESTTTSPATICGRV